MRSMKFQHQFAQTWTDVPLPDATQIVWPDTPMLGLRSPNPGRKKSYNSIPIHGSQCVKALHELWPSLTRLTSPNLAKNCKKKNIIELRQGRFGCRIIDKLHYCNSSDWKFGYLHYCNATYDWDVDKLELSPDIHLKAPERHETAGARYMHLGMDILHPTRSFSNDGM